MAAAFPALAGTFQYSYPLEHKPSRDGAGLVCSGLPASHAPAEEVI